MQIKNLNIKQLGKQLNKAQKALAIHLEKLVLQNEKIDVELNPLVKQFRALINDINSEIKGRTDKSKSFRCAIEKKKLRKLGVLPAIEIKN